MVLTPRQHPLARRRRIAAGELARYPFVAFEPLSATRRIVDHFFAAADVEPTIVMETENVEIIKAFVRAGVGISMVPYQAVARELRAGQFFCAPVDGHQLVRETGWVYVRANRVPRPIEELMKVFDAIRPQLKLAPPRRRLP
jgi:DNA-binding transcriptional LysR family regulator